MILNDFKQQIVQLINNSGLSVEMVYYILKDLMNEVAVTYNQQLQKEKEEKEQAEDNNTSEK